MLPGWLMPVRSPLTSAMKTGTPILREILGQRLQRHGLAGAGGAGDQAVPVGQRRQQEALGLRVLGDQQVVRPWRSKSKMGDCADDQEWRATLLCPQTDSQQRQRTSQWPDTANGPTSSTARAARTRSAARSGPASSARSWSPRARAAATCRHESAPAAGGREGQGRQHAGRHDQAQHRQGHRQPRRRAATRRSATRATASAARRSSSTP